jgi:hypothetical protein
MPATLPAASLATPATPSLATTPLPPSQPSPHPSPSPPSLSVHLQVPSDQHDLRA